MIETNLIPYSINTSNFNTVWVKRTRSLTTTPILAAHYYGRKLPKKKVTPISAFLRWSGRHELEPDLFIFHIGRTGSTLLSECFKQDKTNMVLSEPPIFGGLQAFLEKKSGLTESYRVRVLGGIFNSFSAAREKQEIRTIFKLSTLSNLQLPFISKAFPQTPKIFLQRDPFAVLASYCKGAPDYVRLPYKNLMGKLELDPTYLQYLIRHIEKLYENVAEHMNNQTIILDYEQIDLLGIHRLYDRLHFNWSPDLEKGIKRNLLLYSKDLKKRRLFKGDHVDRKILDLIKNEKSLVQKKLIPYYRYFDSLASR